MLNFKVNVKIYHYLRPTANNPEAQSDCGRYLKKLGESLFKREKPIESFTAETEDELKYYAYDDDFIYPTDLTEQYEQLIKTGQSSNIMIHCFYNSYEKFGEYRQDILKVKIEMTRI